MARLTPQQSAEKWKRNLTSSTQDIEAGVQRVSVNPMEKALAQKDKMRTNWLAAIDSGKWERGLQNVTLQDWKNKMINVGIARIQSGAQAGMTKYQAYMTAVQPFMDNLQSEIEAMPSTTLQDRINRAVRWMTGMSEWEG